MKLNMGGTFNENFTSEYTTIGFDGQINVDVTKPLPIEENSIDFIWSERMLEHIKVEDIFKVFENLHKILKSKGIVRFCMPSCFYCDDKSIDMMRPNNYLKQLQMGHVTWFTYEGIGHIKPDLFGLKKSPEPFIKLKDLCEKYGLTYKLIRWHDEDSKVNYNEDYLANSTANQFKDFPEIIMRRPNSLIFDCIKN